MEGGVWRLRWVGNDGRIDVTSGVATPVDTALFLISLFLTRGELNYAGSV